MLWVDFAEIVKNVNNINNPNARTKVLQNICELDLVDMFRQFNPDKTRFTWRRKKSHKASKA